ncbi:MAG: SMP-30/gluconolactonase/LRE family protein [Usitatibacter sp.]
MRFFLLVLLVLAFPAAAQLEADNARRTIASVELLLKQRPSDATLWFFLARANAELGDKAATLAALEKTNELGDGFLPSRPGFDKVWDHPQFQALRGRMAARLPVLDYAPTAFELEDRTLLPEGIAYDAPSRTFFIGSAQGKVLRVTESGVASEFAGAAANLDAVLGLAVDAPRRTLYVVSTSALTAQGEKRRRNAVVAFDVDSRKLLARYEVPGAVQLNDVTVAMGGRVFASDSGSGAIYEIGVKGPLTSRELLPAARLGGSNGLAASPDGAKLYVAHSTGLAVIDIASGTMKRVANPTRETVAAIDGLYQWQGQLIGVQNLTTPGRVIVISLSPDGESISRVQTLLSHHHNALDEPTTGVVTERGFFLLAATGITHVNRAGGIDEPDKVPRPLVVRIPLPR